MQIGADVKPVFFFFYLGNWGGGGGFSKNQPISFGKKIILTKSVNEMEYADWG